MNFEVAMVAAADEAVHLTMRAYSQRYVDSFDLDTFSSRLAAE